MASNEVHHFSSLEEMTGEADLIVEGEVERVERGREFGQPGIARVYFVTAYIRLERTYAGTAPGKEVPLEIFVGDGSGVEPFIEGFPGTRGLWFLFQKDAEAKRLGTMVEGLGFYMLVSSQGLVAEVNGTAENAFGEESDDPDSVFASTDGRAFSAVADEVRELANQP
ncbi:MAG: hypothetical protein WD557_07340 [Dehalococcoidia bacterium]